MKNTLLYIAVALLIAPGISAQITLTQSSYPASVTGTDSLKMTTYDAAFPSLVIMTDGRWDMSTVTDSIPIFFAYRVPAVTYQYADSNTYSLFSYSYQGNIQSSITSSAILEYGIDVQKANYSLISLTGMPTDSLFIDSQDIVYSSLHTIIAFPATYHTSWSSAYTYDLNFQLSLALFSYDHAPGIVRRYTTEKDTVTGWGKMSIKDASGSPSAFLGVLQVQTIITTADSFFINGAPFSTPLLTSLGITQGTIVTTYQQNYYRAQEVTPLASVTFTDAAYSQPKSATTHIQRLATDAVPKLPDETAVHVYPNPVTGSSVSIALPAAIGECSYELANANGNIIQSGILQTNRSNARLSLSSAITPGIYYLKLDNKDGKFSTNPLNVMR